MPRSIHALQWTAARDLSQVRCRRLGRFFATIALACLAVGLLVISVPAVSTAMVPAVHSTAAVAKIPSSTSSSADTGSAVGYFPITPKRILDTRCAGMAVIPNPSFCSSEIASLGSNLGFAPLTASGPGWSAPVAVDNVQLPNGPSLNSVSCPTTSFCMAVDGNGNAFTWNGTSWSKPISVDSNVIFHSVSCPLASFCMAIGIPEGTVGNDETFTWNGSIWSKPTIITSGGSLIPVSCVSSSFCMAVAAAGNGNVITWNGSSWSKPATIIPGGSLNSVSCVSSSFCMAEGLPEPPRSCTGTACIVTAETFTWNGASWSKPMPTTLDGSFSSLSCASSSFCEAVGGGRGQSAVALSWNGASWSKPVFAGYATSVSCPTTYFCMAVGLNTYTSWNGASWSSRAIAIDDLIAPSLNSVSCPTTSFCMAVDGNGNAFRYTSTFAHRTITAQVGSTGGPYNVTGVVMNVTVTGATTGGYLSVYPAGVQVPMVSNLNFTAGETVSNLVEVAVPPYTSPSDILDQVSFTLGGTTTGSVNVIADVEGYFEQEEPGQSSSFAGDTFEPMFPERIVDTRCFSSSYASTNTSYCKSIANQVSPASSIPAYSSATVSLPSTMSSAQAVVANLTVVNTVSAGYLTAWPAGTGMPVVSNLNFAAGTTVANRITVLLSSGKLSIYNGSSSAVDIMLDINGIYITSTGGAMFTSKVVPARILDTRCAISPAPAFCSTEDLPSQNADIGAAGPDDSITFDVAGIAGVPLSATAVVANLTAVNPIAGGYLTLYPTGDTQPTISDVNFNAGSIATPNLVVAKIGSDGRLTIYNGSPATVEVVLDVFGWYGVS